MRDLGRVGLWDVNEICNLRCAFCYHLVDGSPWSGREVSTAKAEGVLDRLQEAAVERVYLVGGEPFLHRDLGAIARAARLRGMRPSVTTNGTLLKRYRDHDLVCLFDRVEVSIDSFDDGYLSSLGRGQTSAAVREAVGILRGQGVVVDVITVATRRNLGDLEAIGEFCLASGVESWKLQAVYVPSHLPLAGELALGVVEHRALAAIAERFLVGGPEVSRYFDLLRGLAEGPSPQETACRAISSYVYVDVEGEFRRCPSRRAVLGGGLFGDGRERCPQLSVDCMSCFDLIEGFRFTLDRGA